MGHSEEYSSSVIAQASLLCNAGKSNARALFFSPTINIINRQTRALERQMNSCGKVRRSSDYKFFTEFQSHEAEFDYLKSLEIEEKINAIKWCPRVNHALFLLATNGEPPRAAKQRKSTTFFLLPFPTWCSQRLL